jgi:hypothetical protein
MFLGIDEFSDLSPSVDGIIYDDELRSQIQTDRIDSASKKILPKYEYQQLPEHRFAKPEKEGFGVPIMVQQPNTNMVFMIFIIIIAFILLNNSMQTVYLLTRILEQKNIQI